MLLPLDFDGSRVLYLRVDSCFWSIINPLPNKNLVLFEEEVRPLPLSFIIDPMPFKMISDSLGEDPIATSLAHIPHSLIDISVGVNHPALTMGKVVHPHPIVPISSFVEHGASALLGIAIPVASVLPPKFVLGISHPVGPLAMPLVLGPASLIFIAISVVLNSKTFLLVVFPIPHVFVRARPLVRLLRTILVKRLLLDPVDIGVRAILLCLRIVFLPDQIPRRSLPCQLRFRERRRLH